MPNIELPDRMMPTSWRQVPDTWWNMVFDGNLWSLQLEKVPFSTSHLTFADSYRYRANLRHLNPSVRTRSEPLPPNGRNGLVVYIQAKPPSAGHVYTWRAEYTDAFPAPVIGPVATKKEEAKIPLARRSPDYSVLRDQLMIDRQTANAPVVSAAALAGHPWLGWLMSQCSCQASDWIVHAPSCPVHATLPLIPGHLAQSPERPEFWVARNHVLG